MIFGNNIENKGMNEMKHVISINTLISFLVACSLNIVFTIAMVMSYYPLDEDAAGLFCVFGLFCSAWVIIAAAYIIRKGKQYEKEAKEDRRQARKEIIRLLDEDGPMSEEELVSHPEYQERVAEYMGQHEWWVKYPFTPGEAPKETVIDMNPTRNWAQTRIARDDLEFHMEHLLSDRLFEETIDGKYQRYRRSVKAFVNECCVQGETELGKLYDAYVAYCKKKGVTPVNLLFFKDEILDITYWRTVLDSKGKTYYLLGIKRN